MIRSVGEEEEEVVGLGRVGVAREGRRLDGRVFGFGFGLLTSYIDRWILSHLLDVAKEEGGERVRWDEERRRNRREEGSDVERAGRSCLGR